MKAVSVLPALLGLLAGCEGPRPSVETLAADPARLAALREHCRAGGRDTVLCARVAQADLRRFLSGQAGGDEYRSLAELPAIPASFDEPADGGEAGLPGHEDAP